MQTEWGPEERVVMDQLQDMAEERIVALFLDGYELRQDIWSIVRQEVADQETGEPLLDSHGQPVYQKRATGGYVEDWSRLTLAEKEGFLLRIATSMLGWRQLDADLWGEAMVAKTIWTNTYSQAYRQPPTGTREDRTAEGHMGSAGKRYHAVFLAYVSKKANAVVRSMEGLENALKIVIKS